MKIKYFLILVIHFFSQILFASIKSYDNFITSDLTYKNLPAEFGTSELFKFEIHPLEQLETKPYTSPYQCDVTKYNPYDKIDLEQLELFKKAIIDFAEPNLKKFISNSEKNFPPHLFEKIFPIKIKINPGLSAICAFAGDSITVGDEFESQNGYGLAQILIHEVGHIISSQLGLTLELYNEFWSDFFAWGVMDYDPLIGKGFFDVMHKMTMHNLKHQSVLIKHVQLELLKYENPGGIRNLQGPYDINKLYKLPFVYTISTELNRVLNKLGQITSNQKVWNAGLKIWATNQEPERLTPFLFIDLFINEITRMTSPTSLLGKNLEEYKNNIIANLQLQKPEMMDPLKLMSFMPTQFEEKITYLTPQWSQLLSQSIISSVDSTVSIVVSKNSKYLQTITDTASNEGQALALREIECTDNNRKDSFIQNLNSYKISIFYLAQNGKAMESINKPLSAFINGSNGYSFTPGCYLLENVTSGRNITIGDKWSKKSVDPKNNQSNSDNTKIRPEIPTVLHSVIKATGSYSYKGTGFYIGEYNGHALFASNSHVIASELELLKNPEGIATLIQAGCSKSSVYFETLGINSQCKRIIGLWPQIDFAIIEIELEKEDLLKLNPYAMDINISFAPVENEPLATFGFGIAYNLNSKLQGDWSSNCRVFSKTNDIRIVSENDNKNPAPEWFKIWSFVNGCNFSWGDSGSVIVSRKDGSFRGIGWGGNFPTRVDNLTSLSDRDVWNKLKYAAPANYIRSFILNSIKNKNFLDLQRRQIIQLIFGKVYRSHH